MTIASGRLAIRAEFLEVNAIDSLLSKFPAAFEQIKTFANGTTDGTQVDTIYYNEVTSGSAQAYDLLGTLTSRLATGSTISFVDVAGFAVINNATAGSGINVVIGAGSNPWLGWVNGSSGAVKIGPQGCFVWSSPDGLAPTAGTADVLTLTPSSSCQMIIIVWGRSA